MSKYFDRRNAEIGNKELILHGSVNLSDENRNTPHEDLDFTSTMQRLQRDQTKSANERGRINIRSVFQL